MGSQNDPKLRLKLLGRLGIIMDLPLNTPKSPLGAPWPMGSQNDPKLRLKLLKWILSDRWEIVNTREITVFQ